MSSNGISLYLVTMVLILAMMLGALLALIGVEIRRTLKRKSFVRSAIPRPPSDEEKQRRQAIVADLMDLYSGVHSTDALSNFLNSELERRGELWRVHIPQAGPGEIHDFRQA